MTIDGLHFFEGGKLFSKEETGQMITELADKLAGHSGKLFVMEGVRSLKTSIRFLALLHCGSLVLVLPPNEFQDERFLKELESIIGGFCNWPLDQEIPSTPREDKLIMFDKTTAGFLVRTSGTSGKARKYVVHDAELFLKKFSTTVPSFNQTLNFFPPDSIAGIETLLEAAVHGKTIVNPGLEILPEKILELLVTNEIDFLHVTPTFLNLLLLKGVTAKHFQNVKTLAYGSEPSHSKVLRNFLEIKKDLIFCQLYGMSEIGLQKTVTSQADPAYFEFDQTNNPARIVGGLLEVKSKTPPVMILNSEIQMGEWFPTGDLTETRENWLRITGRNDDVINVAGRKFLPSVLEDILLQLDGVQDVTVLAAPHDLIGNFITAKIQTLESEEVIRSKLRTFMEDHVPSHMRPQKFEIMTAPEINSRLKKIRR